MFVRPVCVLSLCVCAYLLVRVPMCEPLTTLQSALLQLREVQHSDRSSFARDSMMIEEDTGAHQRQGKNAPLYIALIISLSFYYSVSVAAFPTVGPNHFCSFTFLFRALRVRMLFHFSTVGLTTERNTNVSVVALVRQVFTDRMRC